jgi:predicted amidophosphoribosyltransferase
LIDDVITTRATISECGKVLLEAGANKVYAASIGITD